MNGQNGYIAALYCRLSRDEDTGQESSSISSQKLILNDFAKKQGFIVYDEYIDDGYSGVSFERPAFKSMMADAEDGKFNTIITKDLSRLGRDYLTTGEYMERIFPKMGIRYIAMSDDYDSIDDSDNEIIPIKNYFNERHARDTSKKTKAAFKAMANAGKYIGSKAPYGYIKNPNDKHHLLIDNEAAQTVRLIFEMACQGMGYKAIAKRLREQGILNPNTYANRVDPNFHKSNYWRQPHDWHPSSIKTILNNMTYLGHVVNFRRQIHSFKNKEVITNPKEKWHISENMHEAIIDQRTWDLAQSNLEKRKKTGSNGAIQIFAGLVKCIDCGYALSYTNKPGNGRYNCSLYNVKGKGYCKSHFITYDQLYEIVLLDIHKKAYAAYYHGDYLIGELEKNYNKTLKNKNSEIKKENKRLTNRIHELDVIIERLYEDSALGRIDIKRFQTLMTKYESEQKEAKVRLESNENFMAAQMRQRANAEDFIRMIQYYTELKELDTRILNELIEKIEVGVKETVDGEKHQTVRIIYRHKGIYYIDFGLSPLDDEVV